MPATIFNSPQHRKKFEQSYGKELTAILLEFNDRLTKLEGNSKTQVTENTDSICPYSSIVPKLPQTTASTGPWCRNQQDRPECLFGTEYENCYFYKMANMIEEANNAVS